MRDALDTEGRYQDLGLIAKGGMGEVRRVRDRRMDRTLAMKLLRWEHMESAASQVAFLHEARINAQLQHPAIIPVHDQGRLPDGRPWFTMKEVIGRTFSAWIEQLHADRDAAQQAAELRRIVTALLRGCEAVAYAHRRGIVHRDLKPQNLMVGDWGEVLVMDWGLAHQHQDEALSGAADEEQTLERTPGLLSLADLDAQLRADAQLHPDVQSHSNAQSHSGAQSHSNAQSHLGTQRNLDPQLHSDTQTHPGSQATLAHQPTLVAGDSGASASSQPEVVGTLAYMPPEQARGATPSFTADVYSLGAVLYTIMAGHAPYRGSTARVWAQLKKRSPPPLAQMPSSALRPAALCDITARALARDPSERYPDAGALADAIRDWLDGTARQQRALRIVEQADAMTPVLTDLRHRAEQLRDQAQAIIATLDPFASADDKAPAWALEDEAEVLQRRAAVEEVNWLQTLRSALNEVPDLAEAHERLADHYAARVRASEAVRDTHSALRHEALLRAHDRGQHAAFLNGDGAVTLLTDPPGAQVTLLRYEERKRILETRYVRELGRTPLERISLPRGSYLLKIRAPGREEVLYPVHIERGRHWQGIRPGDSEPLPIRLPLHGALGRDQLYVPASWYLSGGDAHALESLPRRRLWVDAFVIGRHPVTSREYLRFLNDCVARGEEGEALRHAPRLPRGRETSSEPAFPRDSHGRFYIAEPTDSTTSQGLRERPDWPVVRIDWHAAMAYARWLSQQTSQPWRLPNELEWEKAASGVDGRPLPWGDHFEPTRACILESRPGTPGRVAVEAYPHDVSPYGMRGAMGNVADWCINVWHTSGPATEQQIVVESAAKEDEPGQRSVRGTSWVSPLTRCRIANRFANQATNRFGGLGFRVLRPA